MTIFVVPVLLVGALLLAPFRLHTAQEDVLSAATEEISDLKTPRLEVVFDPTCKACVWDRYNPSVKRYERWLRIGIRNPSARPVNRVSVWLMSLDSSTQERTHFLPLPSRLRFKDDHSEQGEAPTIQPSGSDHTVHIDLFAHEIKPYTPVTIHLAARSDAPSIATRSNYAGRLQIETDDCVAMTAQFVLSFDVLFGLAGTLEINGVHAEPVSPDGVRDVFLLADGSTITKARLEAMPEDERIAYLHEHPEVPEQFLTDRTI
jgi:hypothetical protein